MGRRGFFLSKLLVHKATAVGDERVKVVSPQALRELKGRGLLGCIADLLLGSTEELLVLLLSLLEGLLEEVGVCNGQSEYPGSPQNGSLTLAVGKADSQSLSLGLTLADIGGSVPNPAAVTADVGAQLHVGNN